jgi:hypothetical protein
MIDKYEKHILLQKDLVQGLQILAAAYIEMSKKARIIKLKIFSGITDSLLTATQ